MLNCIFTVNAVFCVDQILCYFAAIHFVLFVEALVLIHIVQLCLKSFTGDKTPDESAEPLNNSESAQEEGSKYIN